MGFGFQIYLGAGRGRGVSADRILEALPPARHIDELIVGWSEEPELYQWLRAYTRRHGIRLWIWFPVFAEHPEGEGLRPQINIATGRPFETTCFDGDEQFGFFCPTDEQLPQTLLSRFDAVYGDVHPDGVFLDRIRFPSMAQNGLESLFGCHCQACVRWYEENGLPAAVLADCYQRIRSRGLDMSCLNPLGIVGYQRGNYSFSDLEFSLLLSLKCRRITRTLSALIAGFRERGLKIGLDLFPPFLAPFVGQDYCALSSLADLIKPMLYRLTDTPAGMGFELRQMAEALSYGRTELAEARLAYFRKLISMKEGDDGFYRGELEAVKDCREATGGRGQFLPGLEVHTAAGRPAFQAQDVRHTVQMVRDAGFDSRVACWDILSADKAYVNAFIDDRGETAT